MVQKNNLKADVIISDKPEDIFSSTHIVLPGQGAFESCIKGLRNISGMINALEETVLKENSFFGYLCWNAIASRKRF